METLLPAGASMQWDMTREPIDMRTGERLFLEWPIVVADGWALTGLEVWTTAEEIK